MTIPSLSDIAGIDTLPPLETHYWQQVRLMRNRLRAAKEELARHRRWRSAEIDRLPDGAHDDCADVYVKYIFLDRPLEEETKRLTKELTIIDLRRLGPPAELQAFQYKLAVSATRLTLRLILAAARPEARVNMDAEVRKMASEVKLASVDKDDLGINKLLSDSYGIFRDVVSGKVTPQVASAAARNCGNVLKGLELRAKFGPDALKF